MEEIIAALEAKGYYVRRSFHPAGMGFDALYIRSADGFPYVLNVAHGLQTAELLIHLSDKFAYGDYDTKLLELPPAELLTYL